MSLEYNAASNSAGCMQILLPYSAIRMYVHSYGTARFELE